MSAATTTPLVTVSHVGICYRRRGRLGLARERQLWALRDVSFELRRGEVLGVIGRNGAGKTTLLRLLAGILRPDRGELVRHQPFRASLQVAQLGFVNELTGRENAVLSGLLLGMGYRQIRARMDEIVDYAELEDFIDEPIAIYSRGMRARLGFSVAYHADPEVILLDETLGAGDASFRKKSEKSMRERIRSERTVVLVTHDASMIREMCDRTVLLDAGVSIAVGPTLEVLSRYEELIRKAAR